MSWTGHSAIVEEDGDRFGSGMLGGRAIACPGARNEVETLVDRCGTGVHRPAALMVWKNIRFVSEIAVGTVATIWQFIVAPGGGN